MQGVYSIDWNVAVLQEISDLYGLGSVLGHRKTYRGTVNHNWVIQTAEGRFVIRCASPDRSLTDLYAEHEFLRCLVLARVPYELPSPLTSTSGDTILRHRGQSVWVYRYIEGAVAGVLDNRLIVNLAKAVAVMHNTAENANLVFHRSNPTAFEIGWLIEALRDSKSLRNAPLSDNPAYIVYVSLVDEVIDLIAGLSQPGYEQIRRFPIHGDWNPNNLVIRNKHIAGIIDFDHLLFDTAIRDIAAFLQYECGIVGSSYALDLSRSAKFLSEYTRHRALTEADIKLIPQIAISGWADSFWFQYHIMSSGYSNSSLSEVRNSFRGLQWYSAHADEITDVLCDSLRL